MELWDLYDENRIPLGRTHPRGEPVPEGTYHLAVIVVILNPRGEVLLTRRAKEKAVCPGWWENTGGAALAGETSLQAILRELREETGLAPDPQELTLLLREDRRTDAHFDIYALTWEGEPEDIRFQAGRRTPPGGCPWRSGRPWRAPRAPFAPPGKRSTSRLYRRIALYLQGQREFS